MWKHVGCDRDAPKRQDKTFQISRVVCFFHKFWFCNKGCEHSEFVLHIQAGIGNQAVTCPRWEGSNTQDNPTQYVPLRREVCLQWSKEFAFCHQCPNSIGAEPPRFEKNWLKKWRKDSKKRKRRAMKLLEEAENADTSIGNPE